MKRLILAFAILAVILAAGIAESLYVDKVFGELHDRIDDLEEAIVSPDDSALDEVAELTQWWEKKRGVLELFTYSPDMRAFSVALAETAGSLECGDDKNALSKCESLATMATNIHNVLDFNFADII